MDQAREAAKMTTERQQNARRANGKRSNGPKSAVGKSISRLNATKHGLYSKQSIIAGECEVELQAFSECLRAELIPVGELEWTIVDRIISLAWRLKRLVHVESAAFEREITGTLDNCIDTVFAGYTGETMLRLNRYETALERSLYRAFDQLSNLQKSRLQSCISLAIDDDCEPTASGHRDRLV